jgi:serine/threonine protein kinase
MVAVVADPLIGAEVQSFRLVRLLGRGGMGRVYEAVHAHIGSRVAIKVIAEQYAYDADHTERFFREARAVNMIQHDGIVRIHDLMRLPDGRPVIVMELVDGLTLRDRIQAGPLPLGGLVTAIEHVLEALAAAHAIGIVHRDLKPDNIILSAHGRAKLLDFGIAKLLTAPAGSGPRTRTGVVLGTPEYMAPEQIVDGVADARSDLYAMGVVLFEAIAGKRPFDGPSDFAVMRAHTDDPPPALQPLRPDLPPALEDVIRMALAKDPDERFANATAMANALRAAARALPPDAWQPLVGEQELAAHRASSPEAMAAAAPVIAATEREDAPPTARATPQGFEAPNHALRSSHHTVDVQRPAVQSERVPERPRVTAQTQPPPIAIERGRRIALATALAAAAVVVGGVVLANRGARNVAIAAPGQGPAVVEVAGVAPVGIAVNESPPPAVEASVAARVDTRPPAPTRPARTRPAPVAPPPPATQQIEATATTPGPVVSKPASKTISEPYRKADPNVDVDLFDPSTYVDDATTVARKLERDAEFVALYASGVRDDGYLPLRRSFISFYFDSGAGCVSVDIMLPDVRARHLDRPCSPDKPSAPPRCGLPDIHQRVDASKIPRYARMAVEYSGGQWHVVVYEVRPPRHDWNDPKWKFGDPVAFKTKFADDC